jgi:hypothetical protein
VERVLEDGAIDAEQGAPVTTGKTANSYHEMRYEDLTCNARAIHMFRTSSYRGRNI